MRISIVTISYNQSRFLESAITSVLNQNYNDLEYIVVDAGSTDGSQEIIENYRKHITMYIQEPDKGPADGLNKGFHHATGEIFGYLNADDKYLPGTFRRVNDIFSGSPQHDVVCGGGVIIDDYGRIIRKVFSDPFDRRRYLYGAVTILQQSTFFRRNAFEESGGFNILNRTCWDGELILSFSKHNKKIKTVNELWSAFRLYGKSISGSGQTYDQYLKDIERFFIEEYGRPINRYDRILAALMQYEKWFINPTALWHRLLDVSGFIQRRQIQ
jgi:glycosyltransferase involved in cell wall biosynthesis